METCSEVLRSLRVHVVSIILEPGLELVLLAIVKQVLGLLAFSDLLDCGGKSLVPLEGLGEHKLEVLEIDDHLFLVSVVQLLE